MTATPQIATPEPATRAELQEALTNMAATAARMPAHWSDRRAAIHERMNTLLDLLESTPA